MCEAYTAFPDSQGPIFKVRSLFLNLPHISGKHCEKIFLTAVCARCRCPVDNLRTTESERESRFTRAKSASATHADFSETFRCKIGRIMANRRSTGTNDS